MCGRFALTATPEQVEELFALDEVDDFPPRYNIAPTQPILIVVGDVPRASGDNRSTRRALLARWGLLPCWVKDPKDFPLLVNARAESAAEKNSFRAALSHRRVLIPASGFYEWHRPPKGAKEKAAAYWVRSAAGGIVAFAGLLETYLSPDGAEMDTAAVLTTHANGAISVIHDRMPVVIPPEEFGRWLDCRGREPKDVADLLAPPREDLFEAIRVSDKVNKVSNTGADLQEPVAEQAAAGSKSPSTSRPKAAPATPPAQLKLF